MAEGIGYQTIAAVGEEVTVATPVAATQRVRNLEFSPDLEFAQMLDESLSGNVARVTPDQGVVDIRGAWRCYDTYTLQHLLLKHFFGNLTAGRYTFNDSLVGTGLTWAIDKQVAVWELAGVKINQLVLTWSPETVELSGTLIAQRLTYNSVSYTAATIAAASSDNSINDSANAFPVFLPGDKIYISGFTGTAANNGVATVVSRTVSKIIIVGLTLTTDAEGESVTIKGGENTSAELAAIIPNIAKRCKIAPDLSVWLGPASAALTSANALQCTSGTLTLTRPMAETHTVGQREILEPAPDNFLEGTLEAELIRYNTNQFKSWQAMNTRLALRLFFDEENGARTQEWIIPNLTLTATPTPVSGPGFIPQSLSAALSIGQDSVSGTTISADTTDDSFNDSGNAFPFIYPGARIFVAGFVNAVNNGQHTVVSRTAGKIVVTTNLTTEAAGPSVTVISRNPFVSIVEA